MITLRIFVERTEAARADTTFVELGAAVEALAAAMHRLARQGRVAAVVEHGNLARCVGRLEMHPRSNFGGP